MNKKYWTIIMENYKGGVDKYYFESFEIAKKNLDKIIQIYANDTSIEEFRYDSFSCSWFDPTYNEYSTYVSLAKIDFPTIHNEIIF